MMLNDTMRKLIFAKRREAIDTARRERNLADMIEAVDDSIIEHDDKRTDASERALDRALAPLIRHVAEHCAKRCAVCRGCVYADGGKHLIDGRTLCEAAADITAALRRVRDADMAREDCKNAVAYYQERLDEKRKALLADEEACERMAHKDLEAANAECAAAASALAGLERKYGVKN